MRIKRLDRLRVIERTVDRAAPRHADHHRHAPRAIRAIAHPSGFVDDLLESGRAEVRELHLGDGQEAAQRGADGNTDDARFRDGRVDDPIGAELFDEAVGHAEDAAAHADILAEEDEPLVAAELALERVVDRLDIRLDHDLPRGMIGGKSSGRRSRMMA